MKLLTAILAVAFLTAVSIPALAAGNGIQQVIVLGGSLPIPGVDIVVKRIPGGDIVIQTFTDPAGQIQFKNLLPGDYVIEIDGTSLGKAVDSLAPLPKKKSGGSSFSLGFGGFSSGGGSSHKSSNGGGAGPVGGAPGASSQHSGGGSGAGKYQVQDLAVTAPIGGGQQIKGCGRSVA